MCHIKPALIYFLTQSVVTPSKWDYFHFFQSQCQHIQKQSAGAAFPFRPSRRSESLVALQWKCNFFHIWLLLFLVDEHDKIRSGADESSSLLLAERRPHMISSFSLSLSVCMCLSIIFFISLSRSQWESFSLCVSLHQCSPLARLCASTRGRW